MADFFLRRRQGLVELHVKDTPRAIRCVVRSRAHAHRCLPILRARVGKPWGWRALLGDGRGAA